VVEVTTTILTAIATIVVLLLGGGGFGLVLVNIAGIFVILVLSAWTVHRVAPEIPSCWCSSCSLTGRLWICPLCYRS
jgi:hypothetical protein